MKELLLLKNFENQSLVNATFLFYSQGVLISFFDGLNRIQHEDLIQLEFTHNYLRNFLNLHQLQLLVIIKDFQLLKNSNNEIRKINDLLIHEVINRNCLIIPRDEDIFWNSNLILALNELKSFDCLKNKGCYLKINFPHWNLVIGKNEFQQFYYKKYYLNQEMIFKEPSILIETQLFEYENILHSGSLKNWFIQKMIQQSFQVYHLSSSDKIKIYSQILKTYYQFQLNEILEQT